jgi:hypothetical protein
LEYAKDRWPEDDGWSNHDVSVRVFQVYERLMAVDNGVLCYLEMRGKLPKGYSGLVRPEAETP